MKQTIRASQWLLLITGVLCILLPNQIAKILPYLMGGCMAILGWVSILDWNRNRKKDIAAANLAYGFILFIVGISFFFQGRKSLFSMGIVWAMIGIRKAAQTLARLIANAEEKKPYWRLVIEFFVRILLALLLLFDPYGKFTPHLQILGAELVISLLQSVCRARHP